MKYDIAFALNKEIIVALLAAMNSVVSNTAKLEQIRINIAVPVEEAPFFKAKITEFFPSAQFEWRVRPFVPPQFLKDYIHAKFEPMTPTRRRSRYMQYARLCLHQIFEDVSKVLYLDADVVALGDVTALFDTVELSEDHYFSAVPNFKPAIFHFGNPFKAYKEMFAFRKTFNSGVLLTDYTYWTETTDRLLREYLNWDAACKYGMFNSGDETLLNVMFKDYIQLDTSWNSCGYGNMRPVAWVLKKNLDQIKILHWSGGHHKPWNTANITYGDIWRKYASSAAVTPVEATVSVQ